MALICNIGVIVLYVIEVIVVVSVLAAYLTGALVGVSTGTGCEYVYTRQCSTSYYLYSSCTYTYVCQ